MTIRMVLVAALVFCVRAISFTQAVGNAEPMLGELIVAKPPFVSCHASTIAEVSGGNLVTAWFAGTRESHPDVAIWMSSEQGGEWKPPVLVADGVMNDTLRYACWNPVLFRIKEGRLFLFYKVGKSPREWWGMMKTSSDNGKTWSQAEKLPAGMLGPIKNKPVQLKDGSILYPSSTETVGDNKWTIHMEKSDKDGRNWRKINIDCDTFGVIQPSILQHRDGRLQLLCRSRQNYIVQSWSEDNGETWSRLSKTNLPNPNSGSDAVTLKNGLHVLVYNPLPRGKDWSHGRNKLEAAVSSDGINWKTVYVLEDHPEGEYSYPAVIQTEDGLVHVTYTYQRKNIKHVVLRIW